MRSVRMIAMIAALVTAALAAVSVAVAQPARDSAPARGATTAARAPRSATRARPRAASPARLTLDQLAGQRIVYAYAGLQPPASLMAAIRAGEAGGVIFFGPNISSAAQIRRVIAQMQSASLASPAHAPLLMMTDQEGGLVRRLPGAPALSEKQIGASADGPALARGAGAGAAQALAAAGMNVNLAPVLDVFRRPGDFIDQYGRSYSQSAATAGRLGAAFIAAQQARAVAATAKHFPGLGSAATAENTDERPVTLRPSLATLRSVDEAPYRTAIAAGVRLVMVSWAVYPALDPRRPAGLSPAVIGGELRGRLGFRGVTITDGIDGGAVTPYGSLAARGLQAAGAGADLILCAAPNPAANSPSQGTTVLRAISSALAARRLGLAAARQSAARILALRSHP